MELQGDGLIENLYHYLWSKDSLFKRSPQINIPDTLVYRYEQPAFWYFTSRQRQDQSNQSLLNDLQHMGLDQSTLNPTMSSKLSKIMAKQASNEDPSAAAASEEGTKIMRKSKKNLTNKEIERVFLKNASPSGIVAVYMYRKKERNIVNVMRRQERLHQEVLTNSKNTKHNLNEDIPEGDPNEENVDDE